MDIDGEVDAAAEPRRHPGGRYLCAADALAEGAGGASSGRPHFLDYARRIFDDFTPLAGDRSFGEDQAVVAGLARFRGRPIAFIGQEKGNDTQSRREAQFRHGDAGRLSQGGAHLRTGRPVRPAGAELLRHLRRLSRRVGRRARPGGSHRPFDRGGACRCKAPFIATIIGEGMSGGAIAIAAASPRLYAGAFDLFGDLAGRLRLHPVAQRRQGAGRRRRRSRSPPRTCCSCKIIDGIVPEPVGGAHRAPDRNHRCRRRSDRGRPEGNGRRLGRRIAAPAPGEIPGHGARADNHAFGCAIVASPILAGAAMKRTILTILRIAHRPGDGGRTGLSRLPSFRRHRQRAARCTDSLPERKSATGSKCIPQRKRPRCLQPH